MSTTPTITKRFLHVQIYNASNTDIQYDNFVDTNWGVSAGSASIESSIIDGDLAFGNLLATMAEIQIFGLDVTLANRKIIISRVNKEWDEEEEEYTGEETTYKLFTGFINSAETDYSGTYRDVIAYDWAFFNRGYNVAPFWNDYWTNLGSETTTLKALRDALLSYVSLPYVSKVLPRDNMVIRSNFTNQLEVFDFDELLRLICELQLCFPHINEDGELEFITLGTTSKTIASTSYETANTIWEDFITQPITGFAIYDSSAELAQMVGETTNVFGIAGNVFLLDKTASELNTLGAELLGEIDDLQYVPVDMNMIDADYTLKLGDKISTVNGISYIFAMNYSNSLLVDQNIKCTASDAYLSKDVISHNDEILTGNKIARIYHDIDRLETQYTSVTYDLEHNYYNKTTTESRLTQTANSITTSVSLTYETKSDAQTTTQSLQSQINQTADKIVMKVDNNGNLVQVKLGVDPNDPSATEFKVDADNINLSSSDVFNLMSGGELNLTGQNITIKSTNFNVDANGNLTCNNGVFNGTVNSTSGTIGAWDITDDGLYYNHQDDTAYLKVNELYFSNGSYGAIYSEDGVQKKTGNTTRTILNLSNMSLNDMNKVCTRQLVLNGETITKMKFGTIVMDIGDVDSGQVHIPFSSFGISSRPNGMLITSQFGALNYTYYWDDSESDVCVWVWDYGNNEWFTGNSQIRFSYTIIQ